MGSTLKTIDEIMRKTEEAYASVSKTITDLDELETKKKEPAQNDEKQYMFEKANEQFVTLKNDIRDSTWKEDIPFVQEISTGNKVQKYWALNTPFGYLGCAIFENKLYSKSLEELTTVYWEDYFYETVYQFYVGWLYNDTSEADGYYLGTFESKRLLFIIFDSSDIKKRHDIKDKVLAYFTMLAYHCVSFTMNILVEENGYNKCMDYVKNILDDVNETGCILNYKAGKYFRIK